MKKDNSFHYALGFDDNITNNDKIIKVQDIEFIISNISHVEQRYSQIHHEHL